MMARPPLDTDVTVAFRGRLHYVRASGPSFQHTNGDVSFPTYGESGEVADLWLYAKDEDVVWVRGTLDEEAPAAQALLSAEALE